MPPQSQDSTTTALCYPYLQEVQLSLLNKLLASFINSTRCVKCKLDQQRSQTEGIRFDNCSSNRTRARYASSWLGRQYAARRNKN